jgi:hypothetical protein
MEQRERSGLVIHTGWLKRMAFCSKERWGIIIANQEKTIEPTACWLRATVVLEESSVNELIRVLVLNISDDLEPIFHFFTECIGIDEARRFVPNHPQVTGAGSSSENRLQPRLEQVKQARSRIVADAVGLKSMTLYEKERRDIKFEDQGCLLETNLPKPHTWCPDALIYNPNKQIVWKEISKLAASYPADR